MRHPGAQVLRLHVGEEPAIRNLQRTDAVGDAAVDQNLMPERAPVVLVDGVLEPAQHPADVVAVDVPAAALLLQEGAQLVERAADLVGDVGGVVHGVQPGGFGLVDLVDGDGHCATVSATASPSRAEQLAEVVERQFRRGHAFASSVPHRAPDPTRTASADVDTVQASAWPADDGGPVGTRKPSPVEGWNTSRARSVPTDGPQQQPGERASSRPKSSGTRRPSPARGTPSRRSEVPSDAGVVGRPCAARTGRSRVTRG